MSTSALPTPPRADRVPHRRTHHGDTFLDPYHWLSNAGDAAVTAHLNAENAYTEARTAHLGPLSQALFEELRSHIQETDVSVPARMGRWWYFSRTSEGSQYAVHARVADTGARPQPEPGVTLPGEQVVLDGNVEAAGRDFYELADLDLDPSGERVAFLFDVSGDERYDLVVRTVDGGVVIDDAVTGAGYGLAWSRDGRYLYYTRRDDAWRAFQVWRHEVGTDASGDVLVVQEDDELFNVGIEASRDERWLLIWHESRTTTEAWMLDLDDPQASPFVVQPRTPGLDYSVEVDDDRILVVHNAERVDFDLAWTTIDAPGREHWRPVLSGADGERMLAIAAFSSCAVLSLRTGGQAGLRVLRRTTDGYELAPTPLPRTEVYAMGVEHNPEYRTDAPRVSLTSLNTPGAVYELDPATGELTLLKMRPVPGYDAAKYTERRVWVTARDGAQVPVSLVHRTDLTADGTHPGVLYGYGAYEMSMDPAFSAGRLSLLDRGVVFAIAHVRGGGELGRGWYDDGKMLAKPNTFHDFVDVTRGLIDQGWFAADRVAAEGGSAGGLLIGAVINEAPELYRAVHAAVPFVDALTTILNPDLPLTVGEWEEWGNPVQDPQVYACMRGYSPYENIRAVDYPAVLATTNLNDTRVFVAEPAKWVQALRDTITSDPARRPVLLKVEMGGGHGGHSGRYDAWRQQAFEDAFVLDALGATQRPQEPQGR
ncbi:S9 family peptidase [Dermacoccaceae bacterium W4C1]